MSTESRATLTSHRLQFAQEVPWSARLWDALEHYEFVPTWARRAEKGMWLLRVHPPRAEQERFGLAPEVLVLVVDGEVLARHLRTAADEVVRAGFRLDAKLLLVVDRPRLDPSSAPLSERLQRMPGTEQRVAWMPEGERWPDLRTELARQLPTTNIFDDYDPVRGDQLMGRDTELSELTTRVMRGDAVGVFGLRKVGKTSLVRGVTDRLDPTSALRLDDRTELPRGDAVVLWYDLGNLQRRTVDELAQAMLKRLGARVRREDSGWLPPPGEGLEALQRAVEPLLDAGRRLCIVLDEYDLLFEDEGGGEPIPHLNRFFRTLRGWSQQWQGQTSLVLIGRDPEHIVAPTLGGVTNPLLAWFTPFWLGPLVPPNDRALLRRLGRRVGLRIGHETMSRAYTWTGGHPLLHRQFGAALHELVRNHEKARASPTDTDPLCAAAIEPFLARSAVLAVQREILALLDHRYPDARALLVDLAQHDRAAPLDPGQPMSDALSSLRRFGLVDAASGRVPGFLAAYIRRLWPASTRLAS